MKLLQQIVREQTPRRLLLAGFLGMVLAFGARKVFGPPYGVTVQFQPRGASRSGLGSLAAQLGVDASSTLDSPQFYAELLRIADLLAVVANDSIVATAGGERVPVPVALETTDADSAREVTKTSRRIREMMAVSADRRTGIVTFVVTHKNRYIAHGVAASTIRRLQQFDVERRQVRASLERQFVDERVKILSKSLTEAENELRDFTTRNRSITVPTLMLERDRLTRVVTLRQSVLISLTQSLEQAKIEEVRDTPLVTVIQLPSLPSYPMPGRTLRWMIAGGVIAGLGFAAWTSRVVLVKSVQTLMTGAQPASTVS